MARCVKCGRRYGRDHRCERQASQGVFGEAPGEPAEGEDDELAADAPAEDEAPRLDGYEVHGVLGRGGEGTVFSATRRSDGAAVAIKVVGSHATARQRHGLRRERDILVDIGPPAVPAVHDLVRDPDGALCLVLERLGIPSLADELAAAQGPIAVGVFAPTALAMLDALAAVHARGWVHCDLKPENVFIGGGADAPIARLIDFGIARRGSRADEPQGERSDDNALFGTAEYMAPEQCEPGPPIDVRTDVYAVGALLFEALTGRPPFFGQPELVRQAHISQRPPRPCDMAPVGALVERVLLQCLAKDPDDRFADVASLRAALIEAIRADELTPQPKRPRTTQRTQAEARRELPCGLLFFESEASSPEVQMIAESFAGALAHAARGQFGVVFEQSATENPVRRAVQAAHALLERGACRRVLVDLAPVQVRERKGERRYRSSLFKQRDRYPDSACPDGVLVTTEALAVVSELGAQPAGRDGWHVLADDRDGDGDDLVVVPDMGDWRFVGREPELEQLAGWAGIALERRTPAIATVIGDAGVGKTRLAAELGQRLARMLQFRVVDVRALEPLGGAGQQCLRDLVCRLLDLPQRAPERDGDGDPGRYEGRVSEVIAHALARACRDGGDALAREAWPGIALALGWLGPEDRALEHLAAAPGALRAFTVRAVGLALRRLALARPLAVILDDAHLADDTTLDALEFATLADAEIPLYVCALARPAFQQARPAWGDRAGASERIALVDLSHEHTVELCRELLVPVEDVPAVAIEKIVSQTGNNPLLLVERVRSLKRDGVVRRQSRGEGWYLAADELERNADIPLIQWLVEREVAALPGELAAHASLIALLGDKVRPGEVAGVLEVLDNDGHAHNFPLDAKAGLRRLLALNVLVPHGEDSYAFRHALMRTLLADRLPADLQVAVHRAAHHYYSAVIQGDDCRAQRAFHAERSGLTAEAAALYLDLADAARTKHSYVEAERLYSRAIDLLPEDDRAAQMRAHQFRGNMRYRIGRYGDAIADLRHAREIAESLTDRVSEVKILLDEATALDWLQEHRTAKERVDRAEALAEGMSDPALRASLLMSRGRAAARFSRADEACDLLEECVQVAEPLGMESYQPLIAALVMMGFIHAASGRLDAAERVFARAMSQAEQYGDLFHITAICNNRVWLGITRKDIEMVMRDLTRTIQISRELGLNVAERQAQLNIAEVLYLVGDVDQAWPHMNRATRIEQRCFAEETRRPESDLLQARVHAFSGDLSKARETLTRIQGHIEKARESGLSDAEFVPSEQVLFDAVDLLTRSATAAEWDRLFEQARRFSDGQQLIEIIELRGLWALRSGEPGEAVRLFEEALEAAKSIPNLLEERIRGELKQIRENALR